MPYLSHDIGLHAFISTVLSYLHLQITLRSDFRKLLHLFCEVFLSETNFVVDLVL
jgi:hypothetical protein